MRIIFVRHGKPDYANDCLTPEGHKQAAATAERLSGEGVREIYVAPSGRAQQTAACTAQRLGIKAVTLSFMEEISWGGPGIPSGGRPGNWATGTRASDSSAWEAKTRPWPCLATAFRRAL